MGQDKCWAENLGGCGGPITAEHLASKSLFGKRIRIQGGLIGTPAVEISIKKLTANILCQKHNNELGRTADAQHSNFIGTLRRSHQPLHLPGSRMLSHRGQADFCVNYGRWLCKTHLPISW